MKNITLILVCLFALVSCSDDELTPERVFEELEGCDYGITHLITGGLRVETAKKILFSKEIDDRPVTTYFQAKRYNEEYSFEFFVEYKGGNNGIGFSDQLNEDVVSIQLWFEGIDKPSLVLGKNPEVMCSVCVEINNLVGYEGVKFTTETIPEDVLKKILNHEVHKTVFSVNDELNYEGLEEFSKLALGKSIRCVKGAEL